jgi:hypothetical protein
MSTTNGSQDNDDDFETIFTAFITLEWAAYLRCF